MAASPRVSRKEPCLDHADRYRRAEGFLTVARGLWGGWDDRAVATSVAAPAWSVPGAERRVRHRGAQFDVDLAPSVIAPGPQRGHVGAPSGPAHTFARFVRHG